jgi:hypothetical protein
MHSLPTICIVQNLHIFSSLFLSGQKVSGDNKSKIFEISLEIISISFDLRA